MRKTKLLTPILTLGTLGAAVTPMTILTSCHKKNTGKDANLVKDYDCEIEAAEKVTYKSESEALKAYLKVINPNTNDNAYAVLKDDARFAYSLGLKSDNFKNKIKGSYSSYTLDFEDVSIDDSVEGSETMRLTFAIKVKGSLLDDVVNVEEADLDCKFTMIDPFKIAFHKADTKVTNEEWNYISCIPTSSKATYTLNGSCRVGGQRYDFEDVNMMCDIATIPTSSSSKWEWCGFMIKQFVLTGLTCNYIDLGEGEKGGALYTHFMSLAEIQ